MASRPGRGTVTPASSITFMTSWARDAVRDGRGWTPSRENSPPSVRPSLPARKKRVLGTGSSLRSCSELVRRPPRRPRPRTLDVAAGGEPVQERPQVEEVPVETRTSRGRDGVDDRLVVGVDGRVDRPGLVPREVRVPFGLEVVVADPGPGVVGEVARLGSDLLVGAPGDGRDRDRRDGADHHVLGRDPAEASGRGPPQSAAKRWAGTPHPRLAASRSSGVRSAYPSGVQTARGRPRNRARCWTPG